MSSVKVHTLPIGWEEKRLGDICKTITKGTTPTSLGFSFEDSGINFLKIENIKNDSIDESSIYKFINADTHSALKRSQLAEGDVLFSIAGTIGSVAKVNSSVLPANTNQALAILRGYEDYLEFEYLHLFLKFISVEVSKQHARGGALKNISLTDIKNTEIKYPPLEEQKRIVAKIDTLFVKIDKAISLTEESLKQAKNLLPSVLNEVFEKGKADGWDVKRLGEVCDVRDGTHDSPKYIDEGYALVTSKNLKNGKLDFGKIKYISEDDYIKINKRSKVDINDILFAMIGTIGNPVLVENPPNYSIKNVALFKQKTNEVTMPFLKYVLVAPKVIKTMTSQAKGATQKFVGLTYLRAFLISFPTIEKQNTLVNYLDKVKSHSKQTQSKLEEQLTYLKQLKSSILSKAFKGEL